METPEFTSPNDAKRNLSRRKLIKRLALVAATGYLAPKAVMISEPWACDKANMPAPHGQSVSGPFC
ncbi:MAG: hypothetical protein IIB66_12020 [Proteobacteria bacterium]|nr:hypothetical protein [Pseudomonadota bacterium]